jgi:tRNA-splicing ligase RtcB
MCATMKIKTFGPVDDRSLKQLERCMQAGDAEYGVLCADHHPGYSQPIGGAIAYEGYVSPSGVGYDIGCGNKAVCTDLTRADLEGLGGVGRIMREITLGARSAWASRRASASTTRYSRRSVPRSSRRSASWPAWPSRSSARSARATTTST